MGMIMTFLPWLVFWVLLSYGKLFTAIIVALAASIVAIAMEKMAGRSPKILQIGTLAVFVVFAVVAFFVLISMRSRVFSLQVWGGCLVCLI